MNRTSKEDSLVAFSTHATLAVLGLKVLNEITSWTNGGVPFSEGSSKAIALYANVRSDLDTIALRSEEFYKANVLQTVGTWNEVPKELNILVKEFQKRIQQLEHYEQKVDALLDRLARLHARGQRIPFKPEENLKMNQEKLERNKMKLVEAKKNYLECDKRLRRTEEVVDSSWKAVCPLVMNLMKFEASQAQDIADCKGRLLDVISGLGQAMERDGIDSFASPNDVWASMVMSGPSISYPQMGPSTMNVGTDEFSFSRQVNIDDSDTEEPSDSYDSAFSFSSPGSSKEMQGPEIHVTAPDFDEMSAITAPTYATTVPSSFNGGDVEHTPRTRCPSNVAPSASVIPSNDPAIASIACQQCHPEPSAPPMEFYQPSFSATAPSYQPAAFTPTPPSNDNDVPAIFRC